MVPSTILEFVYCLRNNSRLFLQLGYRGLALYKVMWQHILSIIKERVSLDETKKYKIQSPSTRS
jgi:hypothetical protein